MRQYSHTQPGTLLRWIMIGSLLALVAIMAAARIWTEPMYVQLIAYGPLLLLLACWILFDSLTVDITATRLIVSFGPGLIKKTFRLDDIMGASAVRNSWLYGWGIRLIPHGWMYNVSGLDAVELDLRDGKKFRIGTDEPDKLLSVILSATGRHR
jgi:hypothetical protein